MNNAHGGISKLTQWYDLFARPFLEKVAEERVPEFDADLKKLTTGYEALGSEFAACFLGSSGVGKSTLINALVAGHEQLVPSGGIGPLTAQALTVRFAPHCGFSAKYHPAKKINQLSFALQQCFRAELSQSQGEERIPDDDEGLAPEEASEIRDEIRSDGEVSASRAGKYRRQAQLLITGQQDLETEVSYLVHGLRAIIGRDPFFASVFKQADAARIHRLRQIIANGKISVRSEDPNFRESLEDHATGFLAPMIQTLDVQWDSPLLADDVALVDLPGLGIEGDVYREVTRNWITERAKAVILVVDHRGITETNAAILRTSGFLNRLLHSAYDATADPASLIIAAVKIDDIADTRRMEDRSKPKREHFADVRLESKRLVQNQIRTQLENVWSLAGDAPSDAKRQVIDNIIARMHVYPLSAIQYRKCLAEDDDDPSFIKAPSDSGVPEMMEGLRFLARQEKDRRRQTFEEARDLFYSRIVSTLLLIETQWEEDSRASEEAERLREELLGFLQPLREEFRVRQGEFRGFLKETLPQRIENLVENAKLLTWKSIRSYLRTLRDAHWKTLQAAVRRGGTFHGAKHIELPRDFALRFEEPIAEVWGETVLKEIRGRTTEFADDCVEFVEQVVLWANAQGAKVKPKLVEAQRDAIRADAKKLKSVGKEAVNDLRENVKNNLIKAIEPPIRRKCETFVRNERDRGTGVRNRILELFDELAEETLEAAVPPARKVLLQCYGQVQREIADVFQRHKDPLKSASEAIVESHESRIRRSDAQKRSSVLSEAATVLANCPQDGIAVGENSKASMV